MNKARIVRTEYTPDKRYTKSTFDCGHWRTDRAPGFHPNFGSLVDCEYCPDPIKKDPHQLDRSRDTLLSKLACGDKETAKAFHAVEHAASYEEAMTILLSYGVQHPRHLARSGRFFVRACDRFLIAHAEQLTLKDVDKAYAEVHSLMGESAAKRLITPFGRDLLNIDPREYTAVINYAKRMLYDRKWGCVGCHEDTNFCGQCGKKLC